MTFYCSNTPNEYSCAFCSSYRSQAAGNDDDKDDTDPAGPKSVLGLCHNRS